MRFLAILATHFFGIDQEPDPLSAWCLQWDIALIEDCSHAMFSEIHRPPGLGAWMIAVIRKVGGGETAAVPTRQSFAGNDKGWHTMPAPDK